MTSVNELYHYGIPMRSGRYPYGSGGRPFQHRIPLVNPGNTVKEDIISGIKKGILIATPLYVTGKMGLGLLAIKSTMSELGMSTGVIKQTLSSLGIMTPSDALNYAKKALTEGINLLKNGAPAPVINMAKETAKNVIGK